MIIGVPKEIREDEYRIAITPSGIEALRKNGHRVVVEKDAGIGSGITNEEIRRAGAESPDAQYLPIVHYLGGVP